MLYDFFFGKWVIKLGIHINSIVSWMIMAFWSQNFHSTIFDLHGLVEFQTYLQKVGKGKDNNNNPAR